MSYRRKRRRGFLVGRLPAWVRFSGKQLVRLLWVLVFATVAFLGWRLATAWNQRIWYGYEPYRILMLSGETGSSLQTIEVLSIWPDTMKSVVIAIPPETIISAVGGYGNYRVGALSELGRVEGVGDQLLSDSVGYTLGIPIHQVYVSKKTDLNKVTWSVFKQAFLGQRSTPEAMAIIQLLGAVKNGASQRILLSEKNVLSAKTEVDGVVNLYFEPALTDRVIYDEVRTIWREAALLQVAVVNASGKPFMATSWSRLARIGGFDVVSVTDQQERLETTTIVFSDMRMMNSIVGRVLAQLFPQATVTVGEVGKYRAQTVIMIGNNSWQWLTNRDEYLKK